MRFTDPLTWYCQPFTPNAKTAGMRIYQLDASSRDAASNETVVHNEQAYMLTQWIEFGVFEAIERRWVQLMTAIIVLASY